MPVLDTSVLDIITNYDEKLRADEARMANEQFEALARDLREREKQRKKLWGDRYPPVYTERLMSPEEMNEYLARRGTKRGRGRPRKDAVIQPEARKRKDVKK